MEWAIFLYEAHVKCGCCYMNIVTHSRCLFSLMAFWVELFGFQLTITYVLDDKILRKMVKPPTTTTRQANVKNE